MNSFATGQTSKFSDKFIKKFTNNAVKPVHEAVIGNALMSGALMAAALLGWAILRKAIFYKALFPQTPILEARAKHKTAHISGPKPFQKV